MNHPRLIMLTGFAVVGLLLVPACSTSEPSMAIITAPNKERSFDVGADLNARLRKCIEAAWQPRELPITDLEAPFRMTMGRERYCILKSDEIILEKDYDAAVTAQIIGPARLSAVDCDHIYSDLRDMNDVLSGHGGRDDSSNKK